MKVLGGAQGTSFEDSCAATCKVKWMSHPFQRR